jgi:hypothetical protein
MTVNHINIVADVTIAGGCQLRPLRVPVFELLRSSVRPRFVISHLQNSFKCSYAMHGLHCLPERSVVSHRYGTVR